MFDNNFNKNLETVKINISEIMEAYENNVISELYDGNINIIFYKQYGDIKINIKANNKNYIIITNSIKNNYNLRKIKLIGDKDGNLIVINNQKYKCDALRINQGHGHVIILGKGEGNAWRYNEGNGNAIRSGSGKGDASRTGQGYGNAIRIGSGEGDACHVGGGNGHSIRIGSGKGDASRYDKSNGHALRSGSGEGDAWHSNKNNGHAIKLGNGNGNPFKIINI